MFLSKKILLEDIISTGLADRLYSSKIEPGLKPKNPVYYHQGEN